MCRMHMDLRKSGVSSRRMSGRWGSLESATSQPEGLRAHHEKGLPNMQFEIRRASGAQKYYWRIVASNSQVLATSETYWNKQDAINAADSVRRNAAGAPIYDYAKAA